MSHTRRKGAATRNKRKARLLSSPLEDSLAHIISIPYQPPSSSPTPSQNRIHSPEQIVQTVITQRPRITTTAIFIPQNEPVTESFATVSVRASPPESSDRARIFHIVPAPEQSQDDDAYDIPKSKAAGEKPMNKQTGGACKSPARLQGGGDDEEGLWRRRRSEEERWLAKQGMKQKQLWNGQSEDDTKNAPTVKDEEENVEDIGWVDEMEELADMSRPGRRRREGVHAELSNNSTVEDYHVSKDWDKKTGEGEAHGSTAT